MPNGTRRAHSRNGRPVRATSIKGRRPPKRRLNAGARRRARSKPLLLAAGTLAGLGALDAILGGRPFTAGVLFFSAVMFGISHLFWQRHKRRQALKAPKPAAPRAQSAKPRATKPQAQQRREALEKARAAHQPDPEPATPTNGARPVASVTIPGDAARTRAASNGQTFGPPARHGQNGHRCDCTKCRAERRAAKAVLR